MTNEMIHFIYKSFNLLQVSCSWSSKGSRIATITEVKGLKAATKTAPFTSTQIVMMEDPTATQIPCKGIIRFAQVDPHQLVKMQKVKEKAKWNIYTENYDKEPHIPLQF